MSNVSIVSSEARVSILMTSFNAGVFLKDAVDSIVRQDFQDWELILVDNNSSDGSIESVLGADHRIKTIRLSSNIGRTGALQTALLEARGQFCAVLDADDVALPNRLSVQVANLHAVSSLVMIGSRTIVIRDGFEAPARNSICGLISHDQLAERNVFVHSSVMFRRSQALEVGGYRDQFVYAQDYDLYLRLARVGQLMNLHQPLVKYRIHPENQTSSRSMRAVRVCEQKLLFEYARLNLNLTKEGRRLNRRRRALCQLEECIVSLTDRRIRNAIMSLVAVFRIDPSMSWISYILCNHFRRIWILKTFQFV